MPSFVSLLPSFLRHTLQLSLLSLSLHLLPVVLGKHAEDIDKDTHRTPAPSSLFLSTVRRRTFALVRHATRETRGRRGRQKRRLPRSVFARCFDRTTRDWETHLRLVPTNRCAKTGQQGEGDQPHERRRRKRKRGTSGDQDQLLLITSLPFFFLPQCFF